MASLHKSLAIALLLPLLGSFCLTGSASAASITDLQKQQAELQQQAEKAKADAEQQQALAQRAAATAQKLAGQIDQTGKDIKNTGDQLSQTQGDIDENNQQIAKLESDLRTINDQSNTLIRQLYIYSMSRPDSLSVFSNQPISARSQQEQEFTDLQKAAAALAAKTQESKAVVERSRDELGAKSSSLSTLQAQQQAQQRSLADAKATQQSLQTNAVATQQQLEAQAVQAEAQAAQIAQKIKLLSMTSNWGSQIVSSDASWYYSQTGNYTRLGSSSETVNNVGCLITSIAMVSTYYGHRITPTDIAQQGSFTRDGYYNWGTPGSLGVRTQPSGSVNWGIVQNELANNRPVIVSIFLPSIGSVNSDGSSHYIVLKGMADGKYLMHDPIGNGRSYNLNQVRSMILTSPKG